MCRFFGFVFCFYFLHRKQKVTRAAGYDADCSGVRPEQFSHQFCTFPLLCMIFPCAAWKRATEQHCKESKTRGSERFCGPPNRNLHFSQSIVLTTHISYISYSYQGYTHVRGKTLLNSMTGWRLMPRELFTALNLFAAAHTGPTITDNTVSHLQQSI